MANNEDTPLLNFHFQVEEESFTSYSSSSTTPSCSYNSTNSYMMQLQKKTSICESTVSTSSHDTSAVKDMDAPQCQPIIDNQNHEVHPMIMDDSSPSPLPPTSTVSLPSINTKKLKLLPLAILVFYNVSGGPFGIEPALHSAGNFYTILGFLIVPFIWSIPEALVTAELGSIFCEDSSGGVAWVEEAFGESWGLICGYLGWVAGATDNAIYPTLFLHYIIKVFQSQEFFEEMFDVKVMRFTFVSVLSIILAYINYRGLEIVGNVSIVVCIIAMSPFLIMTFISLPQIETSHWFQMPDPNIYQCEDGYYYDAPNDDDNSGNGPPTWEIISRGVLWTPFINNLFWNLNSFDSASSFAGEVQSVSKTYPNGIFLGLFLSIIWYIIPLLAITGATNYTQCEWTDGQLAKAAVDIGGSWLGSWTVLAAGISNLALFEAELSSDSYQLMGMAERGHLPKIFAKRSERFDTPIVGIITCTIVIIAMSVADFTQLVELLNFNYSLALLLEYLAFAKLRLTRKDLKAPYRIPLPDWAAIVLIIPPIVGLIVLFSIATWVTYAFTTLVTFLGIVFYYLQQEAKKRGWCSFISSVDNRNDNDNNANSDSQQNCEEVVPLGNNDGHIELELEASSWDDDSSRWMSREII